MAEQITGARRLRFQRFFGLGAAVTLLAAGVLSLLAVPAGAATASTTYAHHHRPHFVHAVDITAPVTPQSKASAASVAHITGAVSGSQVVGARTLGTEPHVVSATATDFTVNTTADTDLADDTSITCTDVNNDCSLRAATEAAYNLGEQSPPVPVVITLPAGTYTLTEGDIYLESQSSITINGAGSASTTITGSSAEPDRVIGIGETEANTGTTAQINGVTVTGGSLGQQVTPPAPTDTHLKPLDNEYEDCGAGIYVADATDILELNNAVVTGNVSNDAGAGVCDNGELYAENDSFTDNAIVTTNTDNAYVVGGGGLTIGWNDPGAAKLTNDVILGNTVDTSVGTDEYGYGGGVNAFWGSTLEMSGDTVSGNQVTATGTSCSTDETWCGYLGGGGLGNWYANTQITNTTFSNNTVLNESVCTDTNNCYVASFGGGIANDWGVSVFSGNTVTGNSASTGPSTDGAMTAAEGGGVGSYAPLDMANDTITGNSVTGSNNVSEECAISGGAGVFEDSDEGGMIISGSTISNNTVTDGVGGGVVYWPENEDSTGNALTNDQITANASTDTYGGAANNPYPYDLGGAGGVYVEEGGVNISGSNISHNTASTWGGGLWIDEDSYGTVNTSTISDNTAGYLGGGLLLTYETNVSLTNTTVANNTVPWTGGELGAYGTLYEPGGGGIYLMDGSTVRLSYATVADNTGLNAGGILAGGSSEAEPAIAPSTSNLCLTAGANGCTSAAGYASVTGTVIGGNTTTSGTEVDCAGYEAGQSIPELLAATSGGWNLTQDGSCGLALSTDINNRNPLLGPLADNGGTTDTLMPLTRSPLIDHGGSAPTCPATDQRGISRPQGYACDIGAVEVQLRSPGPGYVLSATDGGVFAFGNAPFAGSIGANQLISPITSITQTADNQGYWLAALNGAVYAFGDAQYHGGASSFTHAPVVGIAGTADEGGYIETTGNGAIYSFGDAPYLGGANQYLLASPIVAVATTPDGGGYIQIAANGDIYAFGDAPWLGSPAGSVSSPVAGIAITPDDSGYWVVTKDGGIFSFGDAAFYGSLQSVGIKATDVVGISPTADGQGYFVSGADGGVFAFGDAQFAGSLPDLGITQHNIIGLG